MNLPQVHDDPRSASVGPQAGDPAHARLDTWLHAVRLFKTRSLAAQAIRASHVRVDGAVVKPSTLVRAGHRISIRRPGLSLEYVVRRALTKRVGAPIARSAYTDVSPPPPAHVFAAPIVRERGSGRPTKKQRREIDRLRGRDSAIHHSELMLRGRRLQ